MMPLVEGKRGEREAAYSVETTDGLGRLTWMMAASTAARDCWACCACCAAIAVAAADAAALTSSALRCSISASCVRRSRSKEAAEEEEAHS